MTAFERLDAKVSELTEIAKASVNNEAITRARVEALEVRLLRFESLPLRKRLTWLLRGR